MKKVSLVLFSVILVGVVLLAEKARGQETNREFPDLIPAPAPVAPPSQPSPQPQPSSSSGGRDNFIDNPTFFRESSTGSGICRPNMSKGADLATVARSWVGCPVSTFLGQTGMGMNASYKAPDGTDLITFVTAHNSIWIGERACRVNVVAKDGTIQQVSAHGGGQLLTSPRSFCRDALQGRN